MNVRQRTVAAVAAALSIPLMLSGCSDPDQFNDSVTPVVADAHPAIVDVYVSSATGPAGVSPWVRVYVEPGTDDLAGVIDASLRALLVGSPERPPEWTLDVAEGPRPSEVNLNVGALDIAAAARELDLYDTYADRGLSGVTEILEDRYGTWEELHK